MALGVTEKEIRQQVVKSFPSLGSGSQLAMVEAFLLLFSELVALDARIAALEGALYLTDSEGTPLATELDNGKTVPLVKSPGVENLLLEILLTLKELKDG